MSQQRLHRKVCLQAGAHAGERAWLLVAFLCLLSVAQTARAADDTIYGVNFNSPANVVTINPTTGVATTAGTLSFGSAAAALDPVTGRIYYTEYNAGGTSAGRVAYWNPASGTNTIINAAGFGTQIPRLAFNSSGTLYGMDAANVLYTINTSNGQFTTLGTVTGVTPTSGGDLAFSPDGTLYLLAAGTLYTIDTFTLAASSVLNTGISNPTGLTFADNSILYSSDLAFNANIYTINLSTGTTTATTSTAGNLVDDLTSLPKFADLSITKTASSSFIVGTTATYSLTVSNAGPQSASGTIRVRDTLPTGLTYSPSANPGWTCSAAGQVVTCDRASALGAGASSTITLTVNVLAAASPSVNNTATVDSPTFDPSTANNSSTVTTAVTVPPDLRITKTHTGNFTQGQSNATYTLTVTNNGSGPTVAMVTITDTLPTGLTFVSNGGTGWAGACSAALQVVTCQRSTTLNAGASYPALTINVNVASDAPASVTNSVSVAVGGELVTNNNTASDATTITGRADLTIAKSHTGNFTQGQANAPYTITVTNAGRAATTAAITVTDTLPAGLTFVSGSGTGWTNCTAALQVVTCQRTAANTIAALTSTTINLLVNVSATAPASVTNSVAVSGGGESNTGNNSATDPTTIDQLADLIISKTHTGNFTQGQSNAPYTLTVTNDGDGATTGTVTVTDTLPTGLAFSSGSGTGWNNCTASLQVVTCTRTLSAIPANTSSTITLYVNVAANAPASVTNSVAVSGGGEIITNNNSATDPTTINAVADLTITKSHTGNFTQGQINATYNISVTNSGLGPTTSTVTVTDTLPTGLSFVSGGGTGWNNCTASLQVVTCQNLNTLNAGVSYQTLTITVNVAANAPASVTNSVVVSGGGELNTGNDTATDATTINGVPDLTITKTHTGNFTQGQVNATYTITVSNSGTAQTNGTAVTVTDTLPAGLSFVSGSPVWGCSVLGQVVTCANSSVVNAGSSFPALTLTVNVSATAPASVTNTASVSGGGESNTGNNSVNDVTTINPVADLTIVKTHTGNFTRGLSGTYNITVTNSGTGQTSGSYTVTDTLPAGLTPTGWSGAASGWGCIIASQTVTCTNSNVLGAGASNSALTITVSVTQSAASSVTNTATVSGGGQVVTSNDTSSNPTTIVSSSDLSLTKVTNSSGSGVGSQATFTITLTNSGPSDATGVAVRDQLPAGLTYQNSTASVGSYNSATGIWTIGNLASGATPPTLQITARIDTIGSITNTAQVSASNQPDPDSTPNNNNAAEDDQASSSLSTSPPSVTLCKTVQGQPCPPVAQLSMPPGSDITYVITFTNSGGSFAADFVITDPIPANTDIKVGSESHTTPLPTGLTGVTVEYFHSPTSTWISNPVSGGGGAPAGYNRDITFIRWTFNGNLSQLAPNNTGFVSFTVRIR